MSRILRRARLLIPPLPACGERIEVRGFDPLPKNPHPALSLLKGEMIQKIVR
jgi:hypothetical protein